MRYGYEQGRWIVFRRGLGSVTLAHRSDPLLIEFGEVLERAAGAAGGVRGQPFLLGPDGRPDSRVNAFFVIIELARENEALRAAPGRENITPFRRPVDRTEVASRSL